jgi:hypothetical protein
MSFLLSSGVSGCLSSPELAMGKFSFFAMIVPSERNSNRQFPLALAAASKSGLLLNGFQI